MIPKVIHYCWFGGSPLPEKDLKCIESWEKYCPDYEIIRWDESNYDVTKNQYMKEAYEAKKWGFVPDYARLDIIYQHGGIYLDTDVEVIKNLDDLLENKAFMGFEMGGKFVNPGQGFGAEKNMPLIGELMYSIYSNRPFKVGVNEYDTTPSPVMNTDFLVRKGLQANNTLNIIDGMMVYPSDFFCPIDFSTNVLHKTQNTYSIHHYHASWFEPEQRKMLEISQKLTAKFGNKRAQRIKWLINKLLILKMHLRTKGIKGTFLFVTRKIKNGNQ